MTKLLWMSQRPILMQTDQLPQPPTQLNNQQLCHVAFMKHLFYNFLFKSIYNTWIGKWKNYKWSFLRNFIRLFRLSEVLFFNIKLRTHSVSWGEHRRSHSPIEKNNMEVLFINRPIIYTLAVLKKKHFISQNQLVFPGWRNVVVLPYFQLSLHLPLSCVAVFDTTKRNTLLRNCDENLHRLKAKLNILGTFS